MALPDLKAHRTSPMAQELQRWLLVRIDTERAKVDNISPEELAGLQGRIEAWKELHRAVFHTDPTISDVNPYID